jgi:hypothetical protein
MTLQLAINCVSCLSLFWVCGSFLLAGGQALTMRHLLMQLGLLVAMVGSMAAALAPLKFDSPVPWWSLTTRCGFAIVALGLYDARFGIGNQLRHFLFHTAEIPKRIATWWQAALLIARNNAASKRGPRSQ